MMSMIKENKREKDNISNTVTKIYDVYLLSYVIKDPHDKNGEKSNDILCKRI